MPTPLLQACLATSVTLALYAFYCFWEAGREDLVRSFRDMTPRLPGTPRSRPAAGDRARARWSGMAALLVWAACMAAVL
jgi:hypothetical protein